ncbi:MAG: hypothetical protein ACMUJM_22775 [bacterium]
MIYPTNKKDGDRKKKTTCKHVSLPARRFCSICGQAFLTKTCHCGHVNLFRASYCAYCGSSLEDLKDSQPKGALSSSSEYPGKYFLPKILDEAKSDKLYSYPMRKKNEILSQDRIKELFKKKRSQKVENGK